MRFLKGAARNEPIRGIKPSVFVPRKRPSVSRVGRSSDSQTTNGPAFSPGFRQWQENWTDRQRLVTAAGPSRTCTGVPCSPTAKQAAGHQQRNQIQGIEPIRTSLRCQSAVKRMAVLSLHNPRTPSVSTATQAVSNACRPVALEKKRPLHGLWIEFDSLVVLLAEPCRTDWRRRLDRPFEICRRSRRG